MSEVQENDREWEAYDIITSSLEEGDFTNGDLIFAISVLLAELVRYEDFDFNELFDNLKEMSLVNIRILADG